MSSRFSKETDERIALVLKARLQNALTTRRWEDAIRGFELLQPLTVRLTDKHATAELIRLQAMIATSLPDTHIRKPEFVARVALSAATGGDDDDDETPVAKRIPVGTVGSPHPLPNQGEEVDEPTKVRCVNVILAKNPELSAAIRNVPTVNRVSNVPLFRGWKLVEFFPAPQEFGGRAVSTRAFFIDDQGYAPVLGTNGVIRSIAAKCGIDFSTVTEVRDYLRLCFACSSDKDGDALWVVEPGDALPFRDSASEEERTHARATLEPFQVERSDNDGFRGRGTVLYADRLAHFECSVGRDGQIEFGENHVVFPARQEGAKASNGSVLSSYRYTNGWRVLGSPEKELVSVELDPVAAGEAPPLKLAFTLPADDGSESVMTRHHVVVAPEATTFAGLSLHEAMNHDLDLADEIWRALPPGVLADFAPGKIRVAKLPFLPTHTLVLVPHRQTSVAVPFLVGNSVATLVGRQNNWIYDLMGASGIPQQEGTLIGYAKFFFAVIVGARGKFTIVENVEDIPWTSAVTQADRDRIADIITPVRYLGRLGGGQSVLSMHVVFKNALFRSNCEITTTWEMKLTNEDLVLEDQPFLEGPSFNMTVRR